MLAAVIFFTTLGGCVAQNEEFGLGESIYVPEKDLLGSIPNGYQVFASLPPSCIQKKAVHIDTEDEEAYSDTASFYSMISTATGMDASFRKDFTMGTTLDITTQRISSAKRTVGGSSLQMAGKSFQNVLSASLPPSCIQQRLIY